MAIRANVLARNIQTHHAAANRGPERNVDLIFEIGAGLGPSSAARARLGLRRRFDPKMSRKLPPPPPLLRPRVRVVDQVRKIESAEIEGNALAAIWCSAAGEAAGKSAARTAAAARARVSLRGRGIDIVGVEADLIVDFAFLGIAENVVGFGKRLELLLGRLVPGIDVGMILARQLAERLADLVGRGRLLHAEDFVIVLFCGGCH